MIYGKHLGYVFIERLAMLFFHDFFGEKSFQKKLHVRLSNIYDIMHDYYPHVLDILHIEDNEIDNLVGKFAFMLSWLLCWYSYKISDVNVILRIFDYLICSPEDSIDWLTSCVIGTMFDNTEIDVESPVSFILPFSSD